MSQEHIQKGLEVLQQHEMKYHELVEKMLRADGGKLFTLDLMFVAAIHRAIMVSRGFREMIENVNLSCAFPLVRMQIDTMLRLFAATLVDDKDELFMQFLKGVHISKIKDRSGHRMSDSYLLKQLIDNSPEFAPLKTVYDRTSGFIHFSDAHIFAASRLGENGGVTFSIGGRDDYFPQNSIVEALHGFHKINWILMAFVRDWINEKDPSAKIEIEPLRSTSEAEGSAD